MAPSPLEREVSSALLQLSGSESNTPDPLISAPNHLRHRANAILEFLSGGYYSEAKIRQMLGDTPETSKALRLLLGNEEVMKRSGTGGRQRFLYLHEKHEEVGSYYLLGSGQMESLDHVALVY